MKVDSLRGGNPAELEEKIKHWAASTGSAETATPIAGQVRSFFCTQIFFKLKTDDFEICDILRFLRLGYYYLKF